MNRHLAWTLIAAFALGACGAGDRQPEESESMPNPAATHPEPAQPTPEPPPMPEVAEAPAPEPAETDGLVHPTERLYTVQIAAYLSADSAQALAAKLEQRGFPVWTMEVRVGERTYHRIRIGAHPRLGEVRRLGDRISTQFRQDVWVAPIDMSSRIPANAVERTRALLAG